jgi:hypothetical protein
LIADVFQGGEGGDQMEGLEDDADIVAAEFGEFAFAAIVEAGSCHCNFT